MTAFPIRITRVDLVTGEPREVYTAEYQSIKGAASWALDTAYRVPPETELVIFEVFSKHRGWREIDRCDWAPIAEGDGMFNPTTGDLAIYLPEGTKVYP